VIKAEMISASRLLKHDSRSLKRQKEPLKPVLRRASNEAQPTLLDNVMPNYDFNHLEAIARKLLDDGNAADAMKIYLFMADGDNSLDGGYLARG
jgi:hypothetical protein